MSTPPKINIKEQLRFFRHIIWFVLILFIVLVLVITIGHMDDEVNGVGNVEGVRQYEIKTLVSAKITAVYKHSGETVQRGEKLVQFDDRNQRDVIKKIKNEIKTMEIALDVKLRDLEILQRDPLPTHYRHTKLRLQEAEERCQRSEKEVEVYRELFLKKAITRREFLKVEMDHLADKMNLARLQEDWRTLETGLAKVIVAKAKEEIRLMRQQLENKRELLRMEERRLEDYTILAPDSGIVTDIPPRPGNYYTKGDVVVKFSANQYKKVVALVNENQVYKVKPGQKARIISTQYNYLDYGYFYGEVDYVYQLPVEVNGRKFYPVKLILKEEPYPLRFGSSCEITILTGRERILFVLLGIKSEDYMKRRKEGLKRRVKSFKESAFPALNRAKQKTP
ncbi:MAG: efflux RND transporter periplasmic adaptor subunit [Lentisphaeria bacterium]|nr:efflux RND transporter periplasmic adaptor subunit [Lentisphaeria bacterium]